MELGCKISCCGLGKVNLMQIYMLGWVYLRTDDLRAFALLDSSSHELPHSYTVLHSLGLAFCSWQRDCCWSREVGQKVVVATVGMLTVTQLQFLLCTTGFLSMHPSSLGFVLLLCRWYQNMQSAHTGCK